MGVVSGPQFAWQASRLLGMMEICLGGVRLVSSFFVLGKNVEVSFVCVCAWVWVCFVCVCACVRVCVRACVRVCVCNRY